MNRPFLIFYMAIGYLIGSFPTAYIIGRVFSRVDIRKMGSGNVGATNVLRVSGVLPGLITLIVDIGKGFIVVGGICWIGIRYLPQIVYLPLFAGLAVVMGHIWPIFLKFKGGKGVATTLGVYLAFSPKVAVSVILVWVVVTMLTRLVSLSSIVSALSLPIFTWLYFPSPDLTLYVIYGLILALLILWRHHDNIKRLIRNEERKISFSKSG